MVNEDGSVNWDIVKPSEELPNAVEESEGTEDFKMELQHYEIVDGWFSYIDKSSQILFALENFQHQGTGDFGASNFNLSTSSLVDNMIVEYEGEKYRIHQKQYYNSNFKDKDPDFDPGTSKITLFKII